MKNEQSLVKIVVNLYLENLRNHANIQVVPELDFNPKQGDGINHNYHEKN